MQVRPCTINSINGDKLSPESIGFILILPVRFFTIPFMQKSFRFLNVLLHSGRTDGLDSEVRVRYRSLAAEIHGAYNRLRFVQPRLLLPLQGKNVDAAQRDGEIRYQVDGGQTLYSV